MTVEKMNNLKKMKDISINKHGYGINQINVEFSSISNLMSDKEAIYGKQVLRKKIYNRI